MSGVRGVEGRRYLSAVERGREEGGGVGGFRSLICTLPARLMSLFLF